VSEEANWTELANCNNADLEIFFSPKSPNKTAEALAYCQECTVRTQCLEFAIENRLPYGVYGGLTPQQRGSNSYVTDKKEKPTRVRYREIPKEFDIWDYTFTATELKAVADYKKRRAEILKRVDEELKEARRG